MKERKRNHSLEIEIEAAKLMRIIIEAYEDLQDLFDYAENKIRERDLEFFSKKIKASRNLLACYDDSDKIANQIERANQRIAKLQSEQAMLEAAKSEAAKKKS